MKLNAVILDCDFGSGEIEREILEMHGITLSLAGDGYSRDECDAVFTQYTTIDNDFLSRHPRVRAVVRYGVGTDVIDAEAAAAHKVRYAGVPDFCTNEVADHTLALMLDATRSVAWSDASVRRGGWPTPTELPLACELAGMSLGLIGAGRIAAAVATRARAFGLRVLAYDPYLEPDEIAARGMEAASISDVLGADIVSLHVPLTDETSEIIGADRLTQMRPGSVLINVSRGGLIDEAALVAALDRGAPTWAALDVLADEALLPVSPLVSHPRTTITPHVAYYSPSSLTRLRVGAAQTLGRLLLDSEPRSEAP